MMNPKQNSKVTIEDLLHLKRTERPDAEFWTTFERELRQKQLTALVQKRRWWHELPVLLSRRVYVPAGVAAVVAFTLVSVRYATPAHIVHAANTAPQMVAADPAIEILAPTIVGSADDSMNSRYQEPVAVVAERAPVAETRDAVELMPAMLAPREVETPSARSIAANLARLEQSEPELINSVMGNRLSSPARVQAVASVQPEIESVAGSNSAKKYRLIARYADRALSPEPSAPALMRERIARRLGDDLSDGISRIGIVGDRVSLKF